MITLWSCKQNKTFFCRQRTNFATTFIFNYFHFDFCVFGPISKRTFCHFWRRQFEVRSFEGTNSMLKSLSAFDFLGSNPGELQWLFFNRWSFSVWAAWSRSRGRKFETPFDPEVTWWRWFGWRRWWRAVTSLPSAPSAWWPSRWRHRWWSARCSAAARPQPDTRAPRDGCSHLNKSFTA